MKNEEKDKKINGNKKIDGGEEFNINIFDFNSVASSTDCTNLTPVRVEDEDEAESYTDIHDIHLYPDKITEKAEKDRSKTKK